MEYNKNRFQKTNDKKILHKVKKQWVVLSVALLAALGGGATVATTHASANADGANGQNNDQETTVKNRINQNLKLAQNQSANNNASQGQTKQVNVNSLSSDQITKQANMLHNQMLLGAAQGTNTKTANGRQAARQNAETNRINANTSAVASAANQKPAANANHSRMFGAAAPSANFGAMRKPEMRLGSTHSAQHDVINDFNEVTQNPSELKSAFVNYVRANSGNNSQVWARSAYYDMLSMASASNVQSVANNGMKLGSDNTASNANTWIGQFNRAKQDLDTIDANSASDNTNGKFTSLVNDVDSMANTLYNSSINSNVSVSSELTANDVKNSLEPNIKATVQSEVNSDVSNDKSVVKNIPSALISHSKYKNVNVSNLNNGSIIINSANINSVTTPNNSPIYVTGDALINSTISNLINNGYNTRVHASAKIPKGTSINVGATAETNNSDLAKALNDKLGRTDIKANKPFNVTKTITMSSDKPVTKDFNYPIKPLISDNFTAYDIASILDGQNPNNKAKHTKIDPLLHDVLATKENPNELSNAGKAVRDAISTIDNSTYANEYQSAVNDASSLTNESAEHSALSSMAGQLGYSYKTKSGRSMVNHHVSGLADSLKANGNSANTFVSAVGQLANDWANSMSTDSSIIASAQNSAAINSNDVAADANNASVKADSSASAAMNNVISGENSASSVISSASSAYFSNADLNSTIDATASTAAVSASAGSVSASTIVSQAQSSAIASASSAVNSELNSANTASQSANANNSGDSNASLSNSISNDVKSLKSASASISKQSNQTSAASESANASNDSNSAVSASTDANNANNAISSINASASSNSTVVNNDLNTAKTDASIAGNQANSANVRGDNQTSSKAQSDLTHINSDKNSMAPFSAGTNSSEASADNAKLKNIQSKSEDLSSLVNKANGSKVASDSKNVNNQSGTASTDSSSASVKADSSVTSQVNADQGIIASASSAINASNKPSDVSGDDDASTEASMAANNLGSLVSEANASAKESASLQADLDAVPVSYKVPVHVVYENNDGSVQQKYDQSDDQYVPNSDIQYVMIKGNPGKSIKGANVVTVNHQNHSTGSQSTVANGAELFNSDASDTRHALGSDTNYSLVNVSDNNTNANATKAVTPELNPDGSWTWQSNNGDTNNQSTPTFYYKATGAGTAINVQYINQNGYKVNAVASAGNLNGAAELTPNTPSANQRALSAAEDTNPMYSGDVNYLGSGSYGDTINVIAGLSSAAKGIPFTSDGTKSSGNNGIFSTTYSYGFARSGNNKDTNPSYSDYTFSNSEQTVTLPIHGQTVPSASGAYSSVALNIAVRNHKGEFVSHFTSNYSIQQIASIDGISASDVHYGDLLKVDPASFAPSNTDDVASSDYNVDPFNTSSDNTGQNVPEIYVSEDGPKWISIDNRQDAIPQTIEDVTSNTYEHNAYDSVDANGHTVQHSASDHKYNTARGYTDPLGRTGNQYKEPFTDATTTQNTITFNYIHGQHEGTVMPIHVTYRDQNGNVVQEGMINPKSSDYGDMINIPSGANITKSGSADANSMFESGATLPSGYSIDYNKDGTNMDHYIVNSDYNATNYDNYQIGTKNKTTTSDFKADNGGNNFAKDNNGNNTSTYAGNDMTIFVRGQYHTTSNNELMANVKFVDSDGNPVSVNNNKKIPLYLNGYNGNSEVISPSDFEPQAYSDTKPQDDKDKVNGKFVNNYQVTPSDTRYKVTFNGDGSVTTQPVNNDDQGVGAPTTSKNNDGINFTYRVPTNKVTQHTVNVHYFYSDMSDIPDSQTPTAKNKVIPLDQTKISETVPSDYFNLNPYMANPPKGYQFVEVMPDSDTTSALQDKKSSDITKLTPNTRVQNSYDNRVQLSTNSSDDIDIKLVPTARGITFHYYDQNGNAVKPDSDNQMPNGERVGVDFTNGGYSDKTGASNNTHTEFGNVPNNDGHNYDSRYGTQFNVSDIPVPTGYHISHNYPQGQRRYYRFTRNHQDVDVMVVGNQDDVSNDPKQAGNPTVTSGDTDKKGTPATVYINNKTGQSTTTQPSDMTNWTTNTKGQTHQNADTIWVTIHEMDPQNHQIRSYQVPSYITGDTGDQFHIYASDFTPEAVRSDNGTFIYTFTPEGAENVHDTGATAIPGKGTKSDDNYIIANGMINPDGTVHADSDTLADTTLNTPNHVDFYYRLVPKGTPKPINVTYMDGSKAVGYKQINPVSGTNYIGQTVSDTISYTNSNTHGDSTNNYPSGYNPVVPDDKYPTTFDGNHDQDIIIPVMRNHQTTNKHNYVVINHFYSGADGGMNSFVAESATSQTLSNEYSGQQNFVAGASTATYNGVTYSAGSENSTADVINTSDGATPGVVNFNYYSNASMNPSQSGPQGSSLAGVNQPFYVQYFAGSSVSLSNNGTIPSDDYLLGNDTKLGGKAGETYNNVTNNVPVPAGYHLDPSNQKLNYTVGNQSYQVDLHVSRNSSEDADFPLNIIVKDANGNQISNYTEHVDIPNNQNKTFTSSDYNPNSSQLNSDKQSDFYVQNGSDKPSSKFTVSDQYGKTNYQSGTLVYKLKSSQPSDIAPITVHYVDRDSGTVVGNATTLKGNYINQDMSDVTTSTGHNGGTSTVPSGYTEDPYQKVDYQIGYNPQDVDILVHQNVHQTDPNKQSDLKINVVEIDKDNGTYTYLSDVYNQKITSDVNVDPHNYIPKSYAASDSQYQADPNSTAYYVDPADHNHTVLVNHGNRSITYLYDKGHQHNYSGSIILRYYDQNGKQVGYTDVINGKGTANGQKFNRYGQKIDVQNNKMSDGNNSDSIGEATPNGYTLDPKNQPVNYTFTNDNQYVNLYVRGNEQHYPLTVRIHEENGNQPSDVFSDSYEINEPAGTNLTLNPHTYTPAGYQVVPSDNYDQNVNVSTSGLTPNTVDFYYNKDNGLFTKPYIVRYVNQNGKQVGYSDVVSNPDVINKSDVDLTKPSDGGEAVPAGYTLDTQTYRNQPVHDYRFGNDHTITLKVIGNQAKVPMTIFMVEKSPDGRNSDDTHVYTTQEWISGRIGSSDHFLNADQYLSDLPSDGKDHYTVDPSNKAKQVTIQADANGNPYLSIHELANGQPLSNMTDNQAVFYYDPADEEKPAPIYVHYLDENTGAELTKGMIRPSDDKYSNGKWIDTIGTQISDVTKSGTPGNPNSPEHGNIGVNTQIPNGYQIDNNVPKSQYQATFMSNPQNVYIPLKPDSDNDNIEITTDVVNAQGKTIDKKVHDIPVTAPVNSVQTYSPYDYIPKSDGSVYATASDPDKTIQVEPGHNKDQNGDNSYKWTWYYITSTNASQMQVGTINVHYVTRGQNNGQNIDLLDNSGKSTGYYQVDQESDHGLSGVTFDPTDYLNDIPSYQGKDKNGNPVTDYYHLVTSGNLADNYSAVIGYNDIKGANNPFQYDGPSNTYANGQKPSEDSYAYHIGKDPHDGLHRIFGDPTYATRANIPNDPTTYAQNTQDIYVLVAPNTDKPTGFNGSSTPDNEGNNDTGNGNAFNLHF